jgi:hypothetical protein
MRSVRAGITTTAARPVNWWLLDRRIKAHRYQADVAMTNSRSPSMPASESRRRFVAGIGATTIALPCTLRTQGSLHAGANAVEIARHRIRHRHLVNGITPAGNWTGLFKRGEKVRCVFINGSAMTRLTRPRRASDRGGSGLTPCCP